MPRTPLGSAALALLPLACCAGLPLLAATGASVAAVAWIGGVAFGAIAVAAATALVSARLPRYSFRPIRPSRVRG